MSQSTQLTAQYSTSARDHVLLETAKADTYPSGKNLRTSSTKSNLAIDFEISGANRQLSQTLESHGRGYRGVLQSVRGKTTVFAISAWNLLSTASRAWRIDGAQSMGAALAYYTLFSITPVLLVVVSVASLVFDETAARSQITEELRRLIGPDGAAAVTAMLSTVRQPSQSAAATIVAAALIFIGATTVFGELQHSLDRIWKITPLEQQPADTSRSASLWALLRTRILSFGMIIGIGFVLMASLALSAGVSALGVWWLPVFSTWGRVTQVFEFLFGLAVITGLFATIYKTLPRVHVRWQEAFVGAAATAILFTIGKWLIGLYIGRSVLSSIYGAVGSVLALLVWVYYSAQIFLFGAELTWAYAHTYGSRKEAR